MKKYWQLIGIMGLVLLMAACGRQARSGYDNSINHGLDAVAENKFERALTYFDNALTQNPGDKKARIYRKQTQAYVDTQTQLKNGAVNQAVTTVTKGSALTGGAKSLTSKLKALKKTARADLTEYQQLDKQVTAQLAVTNGPYDDAIVKRCRTIDWQTKPYLKRLKPNVKKLLKRVDNQSSADNRQTDQRTTSTSHASKPALSASDHKKAAQIRAAIVQGDPDSWDQTSAAKVPDAALLAAERESAARGGDPSLIAKIVATQYPDLTKQTTSELDAAQAARIAVNYQARIEKNLGASVTAEAPTEDGDGGYEIRFNEDDGERWVTLDLRPNGGAFTRLGLSNRSVTETNWK
ncbi:hypothetical protein [Lactiplantibacillus modestisalitolerans]|uniref:Lipoprotein n=1 Tax=Lactiplantibacillus modestisalitolerans TaxID=1457219 RepID=A0ABV5WRI6_9LACO|nr:hypothetical protein [Lactiplantibacillus modestisalitolerans]